MSDALRNRNTFFRAEYDLQGRMLSCQKIVYAEVEMRHDYRYDANGHLIEARIQGSDPDDEARTIRFVSITST